ncbi:MAG: hypothetical protein WC238_02565 [Parcubacteria group bacterium]
MMVVALLLAMSASAYAVTRAEVREQWQTRQDGVIVEDREKTTSMMIPEYNAGILAEQRKLRQELLGDKEKKVEGIIPNLKRIVEDFSTKSDQAIANSTAAIKDSAEAARENAAATNKIGEKVDLIDANIHSVYKETGRNFWFLILAVVLATAIILIVSSLTLGSAVKPAAGRFNRVDSANAEILAAANKASAENAEILKAVQDVVTVVKTIPGATKLPPPPPGTVV